MIKQLMHTRTATQAVEEAKKEEGDGVSATRKYCAKAIEDDEYDEEADEDEDKVEEDSNDDDLDAFEASHRFHRPRSDSSQVAAITRKFPPSLSLLSLALTPGPLTTTLLISGSRASTRASAQALPSPTISWASSGSGTWDTSSAPATPTTSQGFPVPFPGNPYGP
jgi:hypothetical protein